TAKHMNISILSPDINKSQRDFSVEEIDGKKAIRFGLSGIKNLGDAAIDAIIEKRPYKSYEDCMQRVDHSKINKRIVEHLIKAGTFDNLHPNRNDLLSNKTPSNGQTTLFGTTPASEPMTLHQRL